MATSKKRNKKYTPRPIRANPMEYVLLGIRPVDKTDDTYVNITLSQTLALGSLADGTATRDNIDQIVTAVNLNHTFCDMGYDLVDDETGESLRQITDKTMDALVEISKRSLELDGGYVCKGLELSLVRKSLLFHDTLITTIPSMDIEKAAAIGLKEVHRRRSQKKCNTPNRTLVSHKPKVTS